MNNIETTIIIPAYDEEAGLGDVIQSLNSVIDEAYEVIVVDDGSKDRTADVARKYGVRVVRHAKNEGKGVAMRTGARNAKGEKLIFIDADATYPVSVIPKMAALLDTHDLVTGTRLHSGPSSITKLNYLGNHLLSSIMRLFYKVNTEDPLSGLRGIRKEVWDKLKLKSTGFQIETELTIRAARCRFTNKDIPISYNSRKGNTKLHPIRDGYQIGVITLRLLRDCNPLLLFGAMGVSLLAAGILVGIIAFLQWMTDGQVLFGRFILSTFLLISSIQVLSFGALNEISAVDKSKKAGGMAYRFILRKQFLSALGLFGLLSIILALVVGGSAFREFASTGFTTFAAVPLALLSVVLMVLGLQTILTVLLLDLHND